MPLNPINVGTSTNNGTGDPIRTAFQKTNANSTYLKTYVDNLIQGLKWKQRVEVATTGNITLSGEQTIDGVLTNVSRVLVKDQTNKVENGIYISGASWVRAEDADAGEELVNATVSVVSGTENANTNWTCNAENITLGSTDVTFVNFSNISSGVSFEQLQIAVQDLEDELREGYTGSMQDLFDAIQSGTYDDTQIRLDFAAADNDLALQIDAVEEDILLLEANKANDSEVVKSVNGITPTDGNVNISTSGGTTASTELISFTANYQNGLTYFPAATFKENGVTKNDSRSITADAADPSLDRFDLFVIDLTLDQIVLIKGTAASNPLYPEYDPLTQIPASFISIQAGAATPANVVGVNVWTEGSEWATTGAGPSFDLANTESPASGTNAIKVVTPLTDGQALPFTAPVAKAWEAGMEIAYKIKNIAGGSYQWLIQGNKSNGRGTSLFIDAPFNYSVSSTTYQNLSVVIPTGIVDITKISLVSRTAGLQYYLDDVKLITGGGAVTPSGDFADVRLSNVASDLTEQEQTAIKGKLGVTEGGGGSGSENIAAGAFTGVFDVSTAANRFYDDYTTGAVVNFSVSATKVLGSQARVRIKGDLIGTIPSAWYFSGDPINKNPAYINELTAMYVKEGDFNLVNRAFLITSVGFEPEYQAMLDYATTNNYQLPNSTQQEIDNLKVKQLKQTGIWYELDKVHIFNATYAPTSFAVNFYRLNWKDPNQFLLTADAGKEPSWVSGSGFKVTGTNGQFVRTGFIPATHGQAMAYNNASETFALFDAPTVYSTGYYWAGGRADSSNTSVLIGQNATGKILARVHSKNPTITVDQAQINSHFHICREKTSQTAYMNGLTILETTTVSTDWWDSMTDAEQYLFGFNTAGTATPSVQPVGLKYYLSGGSLRAQRLDLYQILNETFQG